MIEPCATPLSLEDLVAYRCGDLDADAEGAIEAHYFGCPSCAGTLTWLHGLSDAVATSLRQGLFDVVITPATVEHLERAGAVLRKYDVHLAAPVACTSAPGEDMTIVRLHPPLRAGVPLTLEAEFLDHASGQTFRQELPVFQDQGTGEIVLGLASELQRTLGHTRVTLTVRYGEAGPGGETAGPFEMNHAPWQG
jgi:hypothetical protein